MNRPAPWRSIMATVVDRRPFRVGGATVDPISREASWPGGKERLQPQTLKVLVDAGEPSRRGRDARRAGPAVLGRADRRRRRDQPRDPAAPPFRRARRRVRDRDRAAHRIPAGRSGVAAKAATRWSSMARLTAGAVAVRSALPGLPDGPGFDRPPASQGVPPTPSVSVVPFVARIQRSAGAPGCAQRAEFAVAHAVGKRLR